MPSLVTGGLQVTMRQIIAHMGAAFAASIAIQASGKLTDLHNMPVVIEHTPDAGGNGHLWYMSGRHMADTPAYRYLGVQDFAAASLQTGFECASPDWRADYRTRIPAATLGSSLMSMPMITRYQELVALRI